MSASSGETLSPSSTATFLCFTTTFPPSIPDGMPKFCSSPTTGPGLSEVGPSSITISWGATAPAFIGAGILPFSSTLYNAKASKSVNINAIWSSMKSTMSFIPLPPKERAIMLFFDTFNNASPRNSFLIRCSCLEPNPRIFASPMVSYEPSKLFMLATCSSFHFRVRFTFFFIFTPPSLNDPLSFSCK